MCSGFDVSVKSKLQELTPQLCYSTCYPSRDILLDEFRQTVHYCMLCYL